jgi:hypothetical protein
MKALTLDKQSSTQQVHWLYGGAKNKQSAINRLSSPVQSDRILLSYKTITEHLYFYSASVVADEYKAATSPMP